LNETFTKEDLDKAYFRKLKSVDSLNISVADKDFYRKEVKKTYKKAIKYANEFGVEQIDSLVPKKEKPFIKHVYYNKSLITYYDDGTEEESSYCHLQKRNMSLPFTHYENRFYINENSFSEELI
jgi:hypothetical protein